MVRSILPQKRKLTPLDKAGAYFHKTLGALPKQTEETRVKGTAYVARHARDKHDFIDLIDKLGLNDVVDDRGANRVDQDN